MVTQVYQHVIRVEAGTVLAQADGTPGSLDMEVEVSHKDDGLQFEATLKNLARETWNGIEEGAPARISLGWAETEAPVVCVGTVEDAYMEQSGQDTDYVIKGRDESEARLDLQHSQTFDRVDPAQVAADLAGAAGLGLDQVQAVGIPFEEYYPVSDERPVRYWLDELAKEAEKRTGEQWEWTAKAGRFSFTPEALDTQEVAIISNQSPRNVIEIDKAAGQTESSEGQEVEFESICIPQLTKGGIVQVETDTHSGQYKVKSFTHSCSTLSGSGEHRTSGTLTSVDSQFESVSPNITRQSSQS